MSATNDTTFSLSSFYIVYFLLSKWHKFIAPNTDDVQNTARPMTLEENWMIRPNTLGFLSTVAIALTVYAASNIESAPQTPPSYTSDSKAQATHSKEDFAVDGDLSKKIWQKAAWFEYDHNPAGNQHYPNVRTRGAVVWTKANVYIAFECHYESLNVYQGEDVKEERWELWNKDVAEVFLNPQTDHVNHYYEFEIAPNNQWIDLEIDKDKTPFNDANWNSGYDHATRVDEKKQVWTAELRIPASSMKVNEINAGMQWRANFFRAAGQGGDEGRQFMTWSTIPDSKTFHVPTRFGILEFVEKNGASAH